MKQSLHFPYESDTAAGNMARDFVMLGLSRREGAVFSRFYGWKEPAFTFGYSQKRAWVRAAAGHFEGSLIRRPTGGGLVDHRRDLTYALAIPPDHPYHRKPAGKLYRELHGLIAGILQGCGISCTLVPCGRDCGHANGQSPGICFQAPEPFDVILEDSGKKLAGAAMKRNRDGVLIQGSLDLPDGSTGMRPAIMTRFHGEIQTWLNTSLAGEAREWPAAAVALETGRFASEAWNGKR